jgi:quercetin dioxygenase-like cupin family protein
LSSREICANATSAENAASHCGLIANKLEQEMHKLTLSLALFGAILLTGDIACAQTAKTPVENIVTIYQLTDLEKDPSRFVRLQTTIFPPGGGNRFHRHPGDQWFAVQDGELAYTVKGQPVRIMKAGDSVYIARGTIHQTENLSGGNARAIELNIMDKDKPFFEQVPD